MNNHKHEKQDYNDLRSQQKINLAKLHYKSYLQHYSENFFLTLLFNILINAQKAFQYLRLISNFQELRTFAL